MRCCLVLLFVAAAPRLLAQRNPAEAGPETSLVVGPAPYDLSGTGTGTGTGLSASLGLAFRPARALVIEPGFGFLSYRNDFGQRNHWFFPELSVQAEARTGRARPFLGGGAGFGEESRVGSDRWVGTLHAVAGLRLRLGRSWGARGELRLRAVPPFSGHTIDIGIGLVRGMF